MDGCAVYVTWVLPPPTTLWNTLLLLLMTFEFITTTAPRPPPTLAAPPRWVEIWGVACSHRSLRIRIGLLPDEVSTSFPHWLAPLARLLARGLPARP